MEMQTANLSFGCDSKRVTESYLNGFFFFLIIVKAVTEWKGVNTFSMQSALTGDSTDVLSVQYTCCARSESVCKELKSVSTPTQRFSGLFVALLWFEQARNSQKHAETRHAILKIIQSKWDHSRKLLLNKSGVFMILLCLTKVHYSPSVQISMQSWEHVSTQKAENKHTQCAILFCLQAHTARGLETSNYKTICPAHQSSSLITPKHAAIRQL